MSLLSHQPGVTNPEGLSAREVLLPPCHAYGGHMVVNGLQCYCQNQASRCRQLDVVVAAAHRHDERYTMAGQLVCG